MSFMKKMFASVGIGNAEVDAVIEQSVLVPGQEVSGVVKVKGGKVEQNIENISVSLHTSYVKEEDEKRIVKFIEIERCQVTSAFTVQPNESSEYPFTFTVPVDTPISKGKSKVWLKTDADIENAVDPKDRDYVTIAPHPYVKALFEALDTLGFQLAEVECEEAKGIARLPFIQEFEYKAAFGEFQGKLDELEVVLLPISNEKIRVVLEIDRKARGFSGFLSEMLETDESKVQYMLTTDNAEDIQTELAQLIRQYC